MLLRQIIEHFAKHLEAAEQFGFALWSGHEVAAVGALVHFDALDVELSTREGERVGGGAAFQVAAATFPAGAGFWLAREYRAQAILVHRVLGASPAGNRRRGQAAFGSDRGSAVADFRVRSAVSASCIT